MRDFKFYKLKDWLKISPIIDFLKEKRNDKAQQSFIKKVPNNYESFFKKVEGLTNKNVLITVAFNMPELIEWWIISNKKHIKNTNLIVFDNSTNLNKRKEIEAICQNNETPYFSLPINKVTHPSRSHGLALSWIYYNVIVKIKPNFFWFYRP
jgi:hypothetical protein